jgi:DNA polymerase I
MEYVRSDTAAVTRELQYDVIDTILRADTVSEAREPVIDAIGDTIAAIRDGAVPREDIGIPSGMSKAPGEYGTPTRTPQPTYRGAKYADRQFPWEQLGEASKPLLYYIADVACDEYPPTYTADTAEDGTAVDAIAVEHPDRIPECFAIDRELMVDKVVRGPLEDIVTTLGWQFEEAELIGSTATLDQFM